MKEKKRIREGRESNEQTNDRPTPGTDSTMSRNRGRGGREKKV